MLWLPRTTTGHRSASTFARIVDVDVEAVAERGHARHFPGRPSLVALARQALERVDGPVRERWLARVEDLNLDAVRDVTAGIPGGWMSEGARTFVVDFIAANRRRLTQ